MRKQELPPPTAYYNLPGNLHKAQREWMNPAFLIKSSSNYLVGSFLAIFSKSYLETILYLSFFLIFETFLILHV